jgi:hypothetical protein
MADADRQLGEFRIVRELGRGGMGTVYEAVQVSLNRRVALKVLGSGLGLTERAVQRFRREAEAAAKLHHTNIVPVYATGEAGQGGGKRFPGEPIPVTLVPEIGPRSGRDVWGSLGISLSYSSVWPSRFGLSERRSVSGMTSNYHTKPAVVRGGSGVARKPMPPEMLRMAGESASECTPSGGVGRLVSESKNVPEMPVAPSHP